MGVLKAPGIYLQNMAFSRSSLCIFPSVICVYSVILSDFFVERSASVLCNQAHFWTCCNCEASAPLSHFAEHLSAFIVQTLESLSCPLPHWGKWGHLWAFDISVYSNLHKDLHPLSQHSKFTRDAPAGLQGHALCNENSVWAASGEKHSAQISSAELRLSPLSDFHELHQGRSLRNYGRWLQSGSVLFTSLLPTKITVCTEASERTDTAFTNILPWLSLSYQGLTLTMMLQNVSNLGQISLS